MRKTVVLVALLPSLALAATGQRSGSQTITGATSSQRGTVRLTGDLGGTADNPSIVRANAAQVTATGTAVTKSAADWMRDVDRGCSANGPVINVRCPPYNAVGDGVADDTAAIQAALSDAAPSGRTVFFPAGTYRFSATLAPSGGVTMRGAGAGDLQAGNVSTILRRTADVVGVKITQYRTKLEGFLLTADTPGTQDGIQVGDASDGSNGAGTASIRDVSVRNVGGSGIRGANGNSVRLDNVTVVGNGGHGVHLDSAIGNANAWTITGLVAVSNTGDGLRIGNSNTNSVHGLDAEVNGGSGLYILSSRNVVGSAYLELNGGPNLRLAGRDNVVSALLYPAQTYQLDGAEGASNWVFALDGSYQLPILTPYGQMKVQKALSLSRATPTFGAGVPIVVDSANHFDVTATSSVAFTINAPTVNTFPMGDGQRITITIRNASGGALGAVTWNGVYKLAAWTSPANGFSRSVTFQSDGTNWIEVSRTPADVPN